MAIQMVASTLQCSTADSFVIFLAEVQCGLDNLPQTGLALASEKRNSRQVLDVMAEDLTIVHGVEVFNIS